MVVPLLTCSRLFKRQNTLSTLWEPKVDIYLSFLLIFFKFLVLFFAGLNFFFSILICNLFIFFFFFFFFQTGIAHDSVAESRSSTTTD